MRRREMQLIIALVDIPFIYESVIVSNKLSNSMEFSLSDLPDARNAQRYFWYLQAAN